MCYKSERAVLPTRFTLRNLRYAYFAIKNNWQVEAKLYLLQAGRFCDDVREAQDIKSVYDLLDKPQEAMARIESILTCDGADI